MSRIIDVLAVGMAAVVLLWPKPSVVARPALVGEPIELDSFAELQDQRYQRPEDVSAALALADAHLSLKHPEWAIATLERFAGRGDPRVHLVLATARAERLETELALGEAQRVEVLCERPDASPPCPPGTLVKSGVIRQAMQVLVEQGINPVKDPSRARQEVSKVLHATRYRSIKR